MAGSESGFKDVVAMVTGGASGIGEATVRRFSSRGAKVAILDLPSSKGAQLAEELGTNCVFLPGDVRKKEEIDACIASIRVKFNALHVVVNCAGVFHLIPADQCDGDAMEVVKTMFDINTYGTYTVVTSAISLMKDNVPDADGGRGVIINMSSLAAQCGVQTTSAYSGTKGAVSSMTLPLARDLAQYGIRVNSIAPGAVDTPMVAHMLTNEGALKHVLFPERAARPDEIAFLVQHIVENKYFNGAVIPLDAGAR